MGLRNGELKDTVLSKISIDEFEPKTGDVKNVVVVGFNLNEQAAGKDLYTFLNNSTLNIRDVEVAPNTNEQGYFMVFLELDRDQDLPEKLVKLLDDVKNVAGNLNWKASTHLTDDYYPIGSDELSEYLITDPEQYMDREAFEQMRAQRAEDQRIAEGYDDDPKPVQDVVDRFAGVSDSQRSYYIMKWAEEKGIDSDDAMFMAGYVQDGYIGAGAWNWRYVGMDDSVQESQQNTILEFLRDSRLREAGFSDKGLLTMMGTQGIAQFEVISFGDAESALAEAGIDTAPIVESDYNTRIFNDMLGDLNAVKIAEYVVVFNTNTKQALVGKPC